MDDKELKFIRDRAEDGTFVYSDIPKLCAALTEARAENTALHALLDNDKSKIIRNEKDGYPEGRPDRELTLLERVKALCRYAADWKKWCEEKDAENTRLKALLDEPCDCAAGEIQVNSEAWERKAAEAEKENARLREALEMIARSLSCDGPNCAFCEADSDEYPHPPSHEAAIAIAALAGKEPSDDIFKTRSGG